MLSKKDDLIYELLNDPFYDIKNDGTIFVKKTKNGAVTTNWRKKFISIQNGYCSISYKNKKLSVHRIIYAKFIGKLHDNLVINHIDGNPSNNNVHNLELITQSENNKHRYRVLKRPPVIGFSKINKKIAQKIRQDRKNGLKYKELMKKYKLSKSTISYVCNNRTWKD